MFQKKFENEGQQLRPGLSGGGEYDPPECENAQRLLSEIDDLQVHRAHVSNNQFIFFFFFSNKLCNIYSFTN